MDRTRVKKALLEAVAKALSNSGKDLPDLDDSSILASIEGFDSDDWPYSMADIAEDLGIDIPDDVNIFLAGKGKTARRRTLSEVVSVLTAMCEKAGAA